VGRLSLPDLAARVDRSRPSARPAAPPPLEPLLADHEQPHLHGCALWVRAGRFDRSERAPRGSRRLQPSFHLHVRARVPRRVPARSGARGRWVGRRCRRSNVRVRALEARSGRPPTDPLLRRDPARALPAATRLSSRPRPLDRRRLVCRRLADDARLQPRPATRIPPIGTRCRHDLRLGQPRRPPAEPSRPARQRSGRRDFRRRHRSRRPPLRPRPARLPRSEHAGRGGRLLLAAAARLLPAPGGGPNDLVTDGPSLALRCHSFHLLVCLYLRDRGAAGFESDTRGDSSRTAATSLGRSCGDRPS
jgi:hypothetical protein